MRTRAREPRALRKGLISPPLIIFFSVLAELSPPQLGPINNNYNREDNCISKPNKSSAMPIFIFMIAQVCETSHLDTNQTNVTDAEAQLG